MFSWEDWIRWHSLSTSVFHILSLTSLFVCVMSLVMQYAWGLSLGPRRSHMYAVFVVIRLVFRQIGFHWHSTAIQSVLLTQGNSALASIATKHKGILCHVRWTFPCFLIKQVLSTAAEWPYVIMHLWNWASSFVVSLKMYILSLLTDLHVVSYGSPVVHNN